MKRAGIIILTLLICLSLISCGGSKKEESNITQKLNDSELSELKQGYVVGTEKCNFTVDNIDITDDVIPPAADNFYSHYKAEDGKVYVDFCIEYTNNETSDIEADKVMSGKLYYNGKYEYSGFSIIEKDNRSDFTYTNITSIAPLTSEYVHYLFSVPEEVATSNGEIILIMTIGEFGYKVIVREGNSVETEKNSGSSNSSGELTIGDIAYTKKGEFYIDYADITCDVIPPMAGDWYSHYEADDGKLYVDFCIAYKNTCDKNVNADDVMSAKLKYADKFDYKGFSIIEEDSRGDFTYSNITSISPLATEYIHYLFEVPEEVEISGKSIVISFTVDGNRYSYTVR